MLRIAALAGLLLAGCVPAGAPIPDPALQMTDAECARRGEAQMRQRLKDPASAIVEMSPCAAIDGSQVTWARVNAKNSFGGYTSFQTWQLTFRNGSLVQIRQP